MAEWRLFDGPTPQVSTYAYHQHRERVPHLEQPGHQGRLTVAADFVLDAAARLTGNGEWGQATVTDLGCGDGGLLSLVQHHPLIGRAVGYDWAPANVAGWAERGVTGYRLDVLSPAARRDPAFLAGHPLVADITVATEVLEHLQDPHGTLHWLAARLSARGGWLVCSSPHDEHAGSHDASHAWAWDVDGYRALVEGAGWRVVRHQPVDRFQVVQARHP